MAEETDGLTGTKPAIQSGTIVALVVALIGWVVQFWNVHLSDYDVVQLTTAAKHIIEGVAGIVQIIAIVTAMYYRFTATQKIEGVVKTPEVK